MGVAIPGLTSGAAALDSGMQCAYDATQEGSPAVAGRVSGLRQSQIRSFGRDIS